MKPSDLSVVLNGIEVVANALLKVNGQKLDRFWKNSSLLSLSKSASTTVEAKISSFLVSTDKLNSIQNLSTEIKERSLVVFETFKQYNQLLNKKRASSNVFASNLNLEHPILSSDDYSQLKSSGEWNQTHEESIAVSKNVHKEELVKAAVGNSTLKNVKHFETTSNNDRTSTSQSSHKLQKLSDRARERKVPSSRISRLMSYGGLAAGMGLGAVAEVARRRLKLKPSNKDIETQSLLSANPFLSEANANRIVDTLCRVRGAALKLGQMLSIQDNSMINPQLAAVFERVRQSADFMPSWQMEKVLKTEFGDDWQSHFSKFDVKPFAAASIGQVHCAQLNDGTEVAMKIQYPGVAEGIESDIKSLMSIISLWNILPKGLFVENVMTVAQRELKKEVDYLHEAESLKRFKTLLEDDSSFYIPKVYEELCTKNVLTTELVFGTPVDKLETADQNLRNMVCEKLLHLCLKEIFLFRFMQTDPNWSNFFYNFDTNQIVLLDFGACNEYTEEFVDTYMNVIKSAAEQDRRSVLNFSQKLGFLTGYETKVMVEAHIDAVMILGEAFACKKPFDFKRQDMTSRIHHLVPIMLKHRLTPPPEETYSLHRKMSGIFLLCTKLRAVVDCYKLFGDVCSQYISRKNRDRS